MVATSLSGAAAAAVESTPRETILIGAPVGGTMPLVVPVAVAGEGALTETTIMAAVGGAMASLALAVGFLTMVVLLVVAEALVAGEEEDTSPSTVVVVLLPWAWVHT